MWMRGTKIECKLHLPKKIFRQYWNRYFSCKDMQNCFSFHLPARKTFSSHLTTAAAKNTHKQKNQGNDKVCPSKSKYISYPPWGYLAWQCPATLQDVQSIICSTAWEQEGCLGRQHTPAAMLKSHRALLCLLCPQLREELLFHLFWQLHSFPCKPLKLSCGCITWDAKSRRNWIGINRTKIWKQWI